jgi:hypothetical protein
MSPLLHVRAALSLGRSCLEPNAVEQRIRTLALLSSAFVASSSISMAPDCIPPPCDQRLFGSITFEEQPNTLGKSRQDNQVQPHPYLELPIKEITKRIPELKGISPAPDQQLLATILQKTGEQVDDFFAHMVDVITQEDITHARLISGSLPGGMPGGTIQHDQHMQDNYLILRRTDGGHAHFEEFRMNAQGSRIEELGFDSGFFVTSGFALSNVHFASQFQWDSRFLQLGEQRMNGRETYVVAFAQLPAEARNVITLQGPNGTLRMPCQGVAWIDKVSFQILQLRTDLLASQPESGLDQLTTRIIYNPIRFADLPGPLWLPREVNVYIKFNNLSGTQEAGSPGDLAPRITDLAFRNIHRYTNYMRYRVSTKMLSVP